MKCGMVHAERARHNAFTALGSRMELDRQATCRCGSASTNSSLSNRTELPKYHLDQPRQSQLS